MGTNGICPCCGNGLNIGQGIVFHAESHTLVSSDFAIVLSGHEADVFGLFWRNRNSGRPVTRRAILDELYALDPDGGPDSDPVDVLLHRLRRRLVETGLEIVNIYNAGWTIRGKSEKAAKRINRRAVAQEVAA